MKKAGENFFAGPRFTFEDDRRVGGGNLIDALDRGPQASTGADDFNFEFAKRRITLRCEMRQRANQRNARIGAGQVHFTGRTSI